LVVLPRAVGLSPALAEQVADELNVKVLEPVEDLEGLLDYAVTPDFRRLGPRVGPLMPKLKAALGDADGAALRRALSDDGHLVLDVDGERVELGPDDVQIRARAHEEFVLAEDAGLAVALDTTLDDELRGEGLARELVRTLNDLRKAQGLELADRVRVEVQADGVVGEAARRHGTWIAGEVLATEWSVSDPASPASGFTALEVDGAPVAVRLERV
jgi:isoleucyl-tRNA synthetase